MRKPLVSILITLALLLVAISAAADFVGQTDKQVQAVATPILDNLMVGFNQGNYDQYAKVSTTPCGKPSVRKNFSRCAVNF